MTKQTLKSRAKDRLPTRFGKAAVAVCLRIIELIRVPDWRKGDIEGYYTTAQTLEKLAFDTNLHRDTVKRALEELKRDGIITEHQNTKLSFKVNPEGLEMLKSKYFAERTTAIEHKILNAWRMKFARRHGKPYAWPSTHPAPTESGAQTCECAGFCSYPSAA